MSVNQAIVMLSRIVVAREAFDGTLLEAWASLKSFQRKDAKHSASPDDPGNAAVDFHGEKRSNQTHESKTDPDAKLARKGRGKKAKLSYNGNLLLENRNGLILNTEMFEANGTAERYAAPMMLEQIPGTWPSAKTQRSRRTWRRNWGDEVGARLMREQRSTPDMPSVKERESALKSALDG